MKKEIIPSRVWETSNDHEKIADVVASADGQTSAWSPSRPTYAYLVSFLEDVGEAYKAETRLRKAMANNCMLLTIMLFLMTVVAAVGWLR